MQEIEVTFPFRVVCIDDSKKPKSILKSNWVKKDYVYTATGIINGGFELQEIEPESPLYESYSIKRFGVLNNNSEFERIKKIEQIQNFKNN